MPSPHNRSKRSKSISPGETAGNITEQRLRSLIERIERLDEEARDISRGKADVYAEAKGNGFDPKIMKIVIRDRRDGRDVVAERESLVETYKRALGMLHATAQADAA